jgi:hypothetical protein
MDRPKTRLVTLHRLSDVAASHDGMWDALMGYVGAKRLDELHATVEPIDIAGYRRCGPAFRDQALVRHRPDARGRIDSTIVPADHQCGRSGS